MFPLTKEQYDHLASGLGKDISSFFYCDDYPIIPSHQLAADEVKILIEVYKQEQVSVMALKKKYLHANEQLSHLRELGLVLLINQKIVSQPFVDKFPSFKAVYDSRVKLMVAPFNQVRDSLVLFQARYSNVEEKRAVLPGLLEVELELAKKEQEQKLVELLQKVIMTLQPTPSFDSHEELMSEGEEAHSYEWLTSVLTDAEVPNFLMEEINALDQHHNYPSPHSLFSLPPGSPSDEGVNPCPSSPGINPGL